jgi:hypothetical protein
MNQLVLLQRQYISSLYAPFLSLAEWCDGLDAEEGQRAQGEW